MLNKLHIYERFWTCLCPSKFNNLETDEYCDDCRHELVKDIHCMYLIKRMQLDIIHCFCDLEGCPLCTPDDYIFNEKTLSYDKK